MERSDEAYANNFPSALDPKQISKLPAKPYFPSGSPDLQYRHRPITHIPPRNHIPLSQLVLCLPARLWLLPLRSDSVPGRGGRFRTHEH